MPSNALMPRKNLALVLDRCKAHPFDSRVAPLNLSSSQFPAHTVPNARVILGQPAFTVEILVFTVNALHSHAELHLCGIAHLLAARRKACDCNEAAGVEAGR